MDALRQALRRETVPLMPTITFAPPHFLVVSVLLFYYTPYFPYYISYGNVTPFLFCPRCQQRPNPLRLSFRIVRTKVCYSITYMYYITLPVMKKFINLCAIYPKLRLLSAIADNRLRSGLTTLLGAADADAVPAFIL